MPTILAAARTRRTAAAFTAAGRSLPVMASDLDLRERHELSDLLDQLGPDQPTLCEGWTTADLAAHLVVRERDPRSGPGILLGGRFEGVHRQAHGQAARAVRLRRAPSSVSGRVRPGVRCASHRCATP